jgi:hypothetical protein
MSAPFVVFALPRSRTAWLTRYLSYGGDVRHDTAITCKSPADFIANFNNGMMGSVETGAIVGWRLIRRYLPNARFAVIRRPVEEARKSLLKFGIVPVAGELEARNALLDELTQAEEPLSIKFHELEHSGTRRLLFEHCLGRPWDETWDSSLAQVNIQVDMPARVRLLIENYGALLQLKHDVASQLEMSA